jgi:glutamate:GABA antiporter
LSTTKAPVFVREATGLTKNVSLFDAVALNISDMSAGAALAVVGFTMVLLPSVSGVNLVYGSIIAFLLSIPQVIVYTMMTQRIPRTGGDYIWLSRTFGGFWGSSLSFMGPALETMAYLALITLSTIFAIGSVGLSLGYQNCGIASCLGLALPGNIPGANTVSQFVLGVVIFAAIIGINIWRPKYGFKLVAVLSIIGIASTIVGILTLLSAGRQGVMNYMDFLNSIGSNTTYAQVAGSYTGSTFDFNATIMMLPFFAIFVYPWVFAGPAVASELKGGNRTVKWNVPIASFIVFLLVTGSFATMYYVGGFEFITSALANPTLVFNYSFNFWTLAMGVSSPALSWFIGLGWICWNFAILAYGIILVSRYLFAQAFDRFLPSKIAYVTPNLGSPVVAHLIDLLVVIFLIGGASFLYGTLVSLYGSVIASMVYFAAIGASGVVYGIRNEKGQSKWILVFCGAFTAAVFLYLLYQFLAYPAVWGGNPFAYGYVVVSFLVGALIYVASKYYNKKRGIDISLAYKEIPPE